MPSKQELEAVGSTCSEYSPVRVEFSTIGYDPAGGTGFNSGQTSCETCEHWGHDRCSKGIYSSQLMSLDFPGGSRESQVSE